MRLIKIIPIFIILFASLMQVSAETCYIYPTNYGYMRGDSYSCGSFGWALGPYLSDSHDRPCVANFNGDWCWVDWAEEFWVQFDLDDCDSDYSATQIMDAKTDADLFWTINQNGDYQHLNALWVTKHDKPSDYALQANDEWDHGYELNDNQESKDVDAFLDGWLSNDYDDKIAFMWSPTEYWASSCPSVYHTDYSTIPNNYYLRIRYTPPCGNGVCGSGETYSNCPEDCCDNDCTADYDSTCHSACYGYNGCSLWGSCDGEPSGSKICYDSDTSMPCCYGSLIDCGEEEECIDGQCISYCGNSVCSSVETYSNCPEDCCDNDCTADYDSTCHSACDGYNGCSLTSGCGGEPYGSTSCVDSDTYRTCCEGGFTDCGVGETCSNGECFSACGNEVCDGSETYSTCPQDCCDSDCTATDDSICHLECDAYCGTVDSQCNGDTINSCGDSEGDCSGCDYQSCSGCYDCSGGSCSVDDDTECSNTESSCDCVSGSCSTCSAGDYCSSYACYDCSTTCDSTCQDSACYGTDPDCDSSGGTTGNCGDGVCCQETYVSCPVDCIPTGADLAVVDIIPIQVIPDVDMVKGKTGYVRVIVYNYGPEDASGDVTAYFNGDELDYAEGDEAIKEIPALTNKTFDFVCEFGTAGTNLKINASVEII